MIDDDLAARINELQAALRKANRRIDRLRAALAQQSGGSITLALVDADEEAREPAPRPGAACRHDVQVPPLDVLRAELRAKQLREMWTERDSAGGVG